MDDPGDKAPLCSVLMSTYNRADRLPLAIRSIVRQEYPNWELILVNDGGEDVSRITKSFLSKRITLLNFKTNKGKSAAINEAFRHARGDFIAYLDDDDQWLPCHLRTHLDFHARNPAAMFSHSDTHRVVLEPDRYGNERETSRTLIYNARVGFSDFISRNRITWLSVVHKRECFAAVGGMDERLRILVDFDLWRRMAARYEFHHIPEHTGDYFIHRQIDGQITGLVRKDPLAFHYANVLIQRKAIPSELATAHAEALSAARKDAYAAFLAARAEGFHSKGDEGRQNAALALAAKIRSR
jgi:glycosyltransferase involved in cell wall biosynthesis